jgi:3D (Asp-Asp-Asp) domain-containing protein
VEVPAPAPAESAPAVEAAAPSSKEIIVEATAYTASCEGCSGITATGINLLENPNQKVISVDPSVIPLGSKVYVEGYGEAIAGDTGGAIKGNKIDIFIPTKQEAINFGRQQVKVTILN